MNPEQPSHPYEPEFSFKKLISDRADDVKYVFQFKKGLALFFVGGALLGALAAWMSAPTYTARLTFVIDDSKSSGGGGGLSALAGQFGFSLDGLGGSSGVLAGDNVQELLKSQRLIKGTLLSPYNANGTESLADHYAAVYKLNKKWLKYSKDGKITRFPIDTAHYSRLQDSLMHEMTSLILAGEFGIAKTDKKLGFFEVNTTMKDERLAQLFCTRMIKQATDFYIRTKTSRLRNNVNRLQHRADSIGNILNHKTYALSSANQTLLDLNPAYTMANANVEVKERDKIVLNAIFSETVKNLEASKTMLAQETPTVQIVDEPELPLKKNRLKYSVSILTGVILAEIAFAFYLIVFRKRSKI
ncbi:hypothetical protein [Mucilaginibacter polytrichastri]|uniref:Polysaccharide chain length determinant N-terminal domain-containing protein n=1 Tax=Mucilaginibacter polytrichastri TaxID=1302689 RepID=A0A1Q5ZYU9_9SPHI|nr:hypothetical protein [Mucilaginibacter polytrichastri]OKS86926.1 hypothetical protein RG47T_2384 [Mucilaginibacter polytrichastri]SFT18072.1 hypothetical protein SAMN04487890_114109 [Mucilaginibacter polytrichastri]